MTAEVNGDRLTDEEVVANSIVTMVGGQETTTNLIGNGLLTLLKNPSALEWLKRDDPIVVSAVEELLRYESPSQHTGRIAPYDVEMGGKTIKKGQAAMAVMAAGNRDPARFPGANWRVQQHHWTPFVPQRTIVRQFDAPPQSLHDLEPLHII